MQEMSGVRCEITYNQWKEDRFIQIFEFTPNDDYTDTVLYDLPNSSQRFVLTFDDAPAPNTKALFLLDYSAVMELDMTGSITFEETV